MTKIFRKFWISLIMMGSLLTLTGLSFQSHAQMPIAASVKPNLQVAWRDGYYNNHYRQGNWRQRHYRPYWQPYYRYGVGCYKRCVVRHHEVYCRRWCR